MTGFITHSHSGAWFSSQPKVNTPGAGQKRWRQLTRDKIFQKTV